MSPNEFDYTPHIPEIDQDDVEQEYQLMMLEYKNNPLHGAETPSRNVIRKRLQSRMGLSFSEIPINASPMGDDDELDRRIDATAQLIEWSFTQPTEVQNIIIDFLREPTEYKLTITLNRLTKYGVIEPSTFEVPRRPETLADLLKRQLQTSKQLTMDELYEIGRMNHVSKRPHAAVRQTIRRFESSGQIMRVGDTIVWIGVTH